MDNVGCVWVLLIAAAVLLFGIPLAAVAATLLAAIYNVWARHRSHP